MTVARLEIDDEVLLRLPEARDPDLQGRSKKLWLLDDGIADTSTSRVNSMTRPGSPSSRARATLQIPTLIGPKFN
ncbi:MAG: hypothetical protein LC799_18785, partial [Actinobacteria bacterium]|nr:hypothetical protein [Actinomycetota bacterium]